MRKILRKTVSMISVRICHESQSDQNLTMKGWNRSEQETLFFYCPKVTEKYFRIFSPKVNIRIIHKNQFAKLVKQTKIELKYENNLYKSTNKYKIQKYEKIRKFERGGRGTCIRPVNDLIRQTGGMIENRKWGTLKNEKQKDFTEGR